MLSYINNIYIYIYIHTHICILYKLHLKTLRLCVSYITLTHQNTFGICFDVDGVLLRGSDPIPTAKKAFLRLGCTPVVFLTNSCGSDAAKALKIAKAIEVDVSVLLAHILYIYANCLSDIFRSKLLIIIIL